VRAVRTGRGRRLGRHAERAEARSLPRFFAWVLFVIFILAVRAHAATVHDPRLRFQTITTEHFVIYFHQGEEETAARLAGIAEETWERLERRFGPLPGGRTHVVLADEAELPNGAASPLPYDAVVITAAWPSGADFIGNTSDWLRLVFTHEFTHILHLDRSVGWARVVRSILGRSPIAFPNVFLPTWQVEGIATYEESALTGEGRLHASDFQMITIEAARQNRLEPLDRANGGLTDWPSGLAAYAYGLGFHAYLADRFGEEALVSLRDTTAGRFPFVASPAFKRLFGASLGELWRDYEQSIGAASPLPRQERQLTHHGFSVVGPRYLRDTCDGCPREVLYSLRTPDAFPSLNRLRLDGSSPVEVTTRFLGSTTGVTRDAFVFDQQDLHRSTGLYSDLYAVDRRTSAVRRLTVESRLMDPDISPDGRTIAAVRNVRGRRELVLLPVGEGAPAVLVSEAETQFNTPRWSPDGRLVAAERHRVGGPSHIVVVDVATRAVRVIAAEADARIVTPAWRPEGRAIVAAMSRDEAPFNLYEFTLDTPSERRQLTHTISGATWPDISADGRFIVFVGYSAAGFDLFETPYDGDTPEAEPNIPDFSTPTPTPGTARSATITPLPYRPWRTLAPTSWSPVVEIDQSAFRLGAATAASDVLAYHSYALSASWLVAQSDPGVTPSRAEPDWRAVYAYDRWRPTWWLEASSTTSFFAGPPTDAGTPSTATLREREFETGVTVPFRRVRTSQAFSASFLRADDTFTLPGRALERTRAAGRGAWTLNSTHTYGYSISREGGVLVGATSELVRQALGASGDATTFTADARMYFTPTAPHHVLAVRLAGGASSGDATAGRTFLLGGAEPNASAAAFGSDAISLLRGFGANSFAGSHVALANADYRWPLARPQRGHGTWPFFVDTVHAAIVADAGRAWTREFRFDEMQTSFGGELSADVVLGYQFPLTLTVGAAHGHDGSGTVPGGMRVFVRIGRAF